MTSRRRKPPVLTFSEELNDLMADNALASAPESRPERAAGEIVPAPPDTPKTDTPKTDTSEADTSEARAALNSAPPDAPAPEPAMAKPAAPKPAVATPETRPRKPARKPAPKRAGTPARTEDRSAKRTISVRIPIYDPALLERVRADARIYGASENRLLAVHVRAAANRLRALIAEGAAMSLDPARHGTNALTSYATSLIMTEDELDAITARLDPRAYFGPSRNLALAIAQLIDTDANPDPT